MVTRIGARKPRKLYLREWRNHYGLTLEQLAGRLETSRETISRWENGHRLVNTDILAELADAIGHGLEPQDFYRHPAQPSADELLRQLPEEQKAAAWTVLESMRKAN